MLDGFVAVVVLQVLVEARQVALVLHLLHENEAWYTMNVFRISDCYGDTGSVLAVISVKEGVVALNEGVETNGNVKARSQVENARMLGEEPKAVIGETSCRTKSS